MTLIRLIRKYLFISMLLVLAVGCVSHYFIFRFFIHYSTDRMLTEQQDVLESYIAEFDTLTLASTLVLEPPRIAQKEISDRNEYPDRAFKDTLMFSSEAGTLMPYRQLHFTASYKNKDYLVTINAPTLISNDLFYAIISSLFVLVVLFILFTYIIELFLKRNIWRPLYLNLEKLTNYDLKANSTLNLRNPGIKEFDEINQVIMRMVEKINEDYENSRIFIEDASHEMQTPLSIIKSKLDLLLQADLLKESSQQQEAIQAMYRSVDRLSKLNKSLLLINKINNNQFDNQKQLELNTLLNTYLTDLEELFEAKNLTTQTDIHTCKLFIDPALAEMLLSNLLSNTLKYSTINGTVSISLTDTSLTISNNCEKTDQPANLFIRMSKSSQSPDSTGLGLNIVKTICNKQNYDISYDYPTETTFRINIIFRNNA